MTHTDYCIKNRSLTFAPQLGRGVGGGALEGDRAGEGVEAQDEVAVLAEVELAAGEGRQLEGDALEPHAGASAAADAAAADTAAASWCAGNHCAGRGVWCGMRPPLGAALWLLTLLLWIPRFREGAPWSRGGADG